MSLESRTRSNQPRKGQQMSEEGPEIPTSMYRELFDKTPIIGFVVDKHMRIVAMTDRCLLAASLSRQDVIGSDVFETFPDNPDDPTADGSQVLRASLERAFATGEPEVLPRQRYDARAEPGGPFQERYWLPENVPVRDLVGNVAYVIHTVIDAG
jgi:PAS domain-containing protein